MKSCNQSWQPPTCFLCGFGNFEWNIKPHTGNEIENYKVLPTNYNKWKQDVVTSFMLITKHVKVQHENYPHVPCFVMVFPCLLNSHFLKKYSGFSIISQHWYGGGSWNSFFWNTRTHLSGIVNTMLAEALVKQGARGSTAMILTYISQNIQWSVIIIRCNRTW